MFLLHVYKYIFMFTRHEARSLRQLCWAKAKEGAGETFIFLRGEVPYRGRIAYHYPMRNPAQDSLIGFAVDRVMNYVPQARFAEFEKAVTRASLGHRAQFVLWVPAPVTGQPRQWGQVVRPEKLEKKQIRSHLRYRWTACLFPEDLQDVSQGIPPANGERSKPSRWWSEFRAKYPERAAAFDSSSEPT
jgi:hypothetical protein